MAKKGRPLHTEYPAVISKLDPLMIRVSETVLLVGSTSYTAKVKMGAMFNGFFVYVSGVGTPIFKEKVDITYYSTESDNNRSEGSNAWQHITAQARDWMDDLEESMQSEDAQKNIVDLLREMKYQEHYDETGGIIDEDYLAKYGANFEFVTNQPSYVSLILQQLEVLNEAINGTNGLNARISKIETKVGDIDNTLNQTIDPSIDAIKGSVDTSNTNLSNINGQLTTMNNTTLPTNVAQPIATAITNGLQSLVGKMNDVLDEVLLVKGYVSTDNGGTVTSIMDRANTILNDNSTGIPSVNNKLTDGSTGLSAIKNYVENRTSEIQSNGDIYTGVANIFSEIENNTYGLEAIKDAVGSSGGDVSTIAGKVNDLHRWIGTGTPNMRDMLDDVQEKVSTGSRNLYSIVCRNNDDNSLYDIICDPNTRAFNWDGSKGEYFAQTELSRRDLLDTNDNYRVKATTS